ncbi:MAG TPA: hypothetical protein VFP50_12585 [Anaeromyxobacteraceae bacterium]|nr:hypothetical protein [Anaeromyxobacteraceae bacterium]
MPWDDGKDSKPVRVIVELPPGLDRLARLMYVHDAGPWELFRPFLLGFGATLLVCGGYYVLLRLRVI